MCVYYTHIYIYIYVLYHIYIYECYIHPNHITRTIPELQKKSHESTLLPVIK